MIQSFIDLQIWGTPDECYERIVDIQSKVGNEGFIKLVGPDSHSLTQYKAQNHLSYATNQKVLGTAKSVKKGSFINGTIDTADLAGDAVTSAKIANNAIAPGRSGVRVCWPSGVSSNKTIPSAARAQPRNKREPATEGTRMKPR